MRAFLFFLFCTFAGGNSLSASAFSVLPSEMQSLTWFQSTILAGIGQPRVDSAEDLQLGVPGTAKTLPVRLWKIASSRGLVLILPGTGGGATSAISNVLAEGMNELGYDALVLANPFSAEFQTSFSSDGIIGLPQRDAPDAHRMLRAATALYASRHGYPRNLVLLGSSLGAMYAAIEAAGDSEFHYDKVIALNPPVSLSYGMEQLDQMIRLKLRDQDGPPDLNFELGWAFMQAKEGVTTAALEGIKMFLPTDRSRALKVIGGSFQGALVTIATNLFEAHPEVFGETRLRVANGSLRSITFEKFIGYASAALAARGGGGAALTAEIQKINLLSMLKMVQRPERLTVITNADDFLLRKGDLKKLEQALGSRLQVFGGGGHCGNYWAPSFKKATAAVLLR